MGDRIIVVGSGAREHALTWKLAQSPLVGEIISMPGNPGTARFGTNLPIGVLDVEGIAAAAVERRADLVVVGPEAPLAAGLADALREQGVAVCGPSQEATRIESSKSWAKQLMQSAGIPTARSTIVKTAQEVGQALTEFARPVVIKADGLAAGKGVVIVDSDADASEVCNAMLSGSLLGEPAGSLVIEECLRGQEVSVLALTDGQTVVPLLPACDYKPAFDDDRGPNTGGMGAYAPEPLIDPATLQQITDVILEPAVRAMANAGCPMRGVLYAGLMMTDCGPMVLEFNARFGDPETQVILPLLESDLYPLLQATATGSLESVAAPDWSMQKAVGVVLASGGYPDAYETGMPIADGGQIEASEVFYAGVKATDDGHLATAGGRVLTAVGLGTTWEEAAGRAYERAGRISFAGMQFRSDIARREFAV